MATVLDAAEYILEQIEEGEHKTKWSHVGYIDRTFRAANDTVETQLKSTCKTMPKNGNDRYLYFGEKFFESIQKDRKEFVRSKNYLYSFLRILWEVNRQYSEHVNSQTQKIGKNPWIYVNYKDIAEIMDCSSDEKAIGILQALEELGYLQYKGVYDLYITIKKFYAQDKYGMRITIFAQKSWMNWCVQRLSAPTWIYIRAR